MSSKKDRRSKIPTETHRQAESLARELFRPINRPLAGGHAQDEVEEEISYMRRPPKQRKARDTDSS